MSVTRIEGIHKNKGKKADDDAVLRERYCKISTRVRKSEREKVSLTSLMKEYE